MLRSEQICSRNIFESVWKEYCIGRNTLWCKVIFDIFSNTKHIWWHHADRTHYNIRNISYSILKKLIVKCTNTHSTTTTHYNITSEKRKTTTNPIECFISHFMLLSLLNWTSKLACVPDPMFEQFDRKVPQKNKQAKIVDGFISLEQTAHTTLSNGSFAMLWHVSNEQIHHLNVL